MSPSLEQVTLIGYWKIQIPCRLGKVHRRLTYALIFQKHHLSVSWCFYLSLFYGLSSGAVFALRKQELRELGPGNDLKYFHSCSVSKVRPAASLQQPAHIVLSHRPRSTEMRR